MFPDIDGQQRRLALGERIFGISSLDQLERSAIGDQPRPAAAELRHGGLGEVGLELVVASECGVDFLLQRAAGSTAAIRLERVPVKRVVPGLRGIVEDAALVRLS